MRLTTTHKLRHGGPAALVIMGLPALLLLACGAAATPDYFDTPFLGSLKVDIEGGGRPTPRLPVGEASASFTQLDDGQARLLVYGSLEEEGDMSFSFVGRYEEQSFQGGTQSLTLRIDPAGQISGGGTLDDQIFSFSGQVSSAAFTLTLQSRPTPAAAATSFPSITFTYDLAPEGPEEPSDTSTMQCTQVQWEWRSVANIGEGTMSMMQVPVCLN